MNAYRIEFRLGVYAFQDPPLGVVAPFFLYRNAALQPIQLEIFIKFSPLTRTFSPEQAMSSLSISRICTMKGNKRFCKKLAV